MRRLQLTTLAMLLAFTLAGCAATGAAGPKAALPVTTPQVPVELETLLKRPGLEDLLERAAEHRIGLVLGLIENGPSGRPVLRQVSWRADAEYFYPASSVKLFAAVAALEYLHELRRETSLPIDADTPLVFHPLFAGEKLEDQDPSNLEGGTITVRHELRKLFLVSDNEAYNRLYELVGQDRLAASLERAGLGSARLVHRLSESRSAEENRRSPQIDFRGKDFRHRLPERSAPALPPPPAMPGLNIGKGYFAGETLVKEPIDFSGKNRISLAELQRGLCKVLHPEVDCGPGGSFGLDERDRAMLREAMGTWPRESKNPVYLPAEYPDDWGKFLLPGLLRQLPQEQIRIDNKFGQAYGFSTENALVTDKQSGRSFFLAATIYTNADGILNDDQYEYKTVARTFFQELGEGLAGLLRPRHSQK